MAEPPITGNTSQQWTNHEIESILQHFITKRSEIGDAGNFKKKTYTSAAEAILGQTRTWEQVKTKWQGLKATYRAIQTYQDTSGVHWDTPDDAEIGRGANVTTDAEAQKNHPMKPFRNRGWQWLRYMEKILPVAGATGAHSYAPTEAAMEVDATIQASTPISIAASTPASAITSTSAASTSAISSADIISEQPAAKRQRLAPTEHKKKADKGKGKLRNLSDHSSPHSSNHSLPSRTPSTSQRVDKVTPAVALVELHGSIQQMTQAILAVAKPPESTEDKASIQYQKAARLVQEYNDGLSVMEKAALIVFFGDHPREVDLYVSRLENDEIRREVIRQWMEVWPYD
ncbi:hypothetical protein BYT27DRAFT_7243939 [Phlegmacium glaucopus]|nr:hypothetical protein BYT27DRAFT_7243939 [Phlegmacium glaucopus]